MQRLPKRTNAWHSYAHDSTPSVSCSNPRSTNQTFTRPALTYTSERVLLFYTISLRTVCPIRTIISCGIV